MKYARRCDATGKGINEGFCFGDGERYFANESDAKEHAITIGYESLDEAYEDDAYYWTTWDESEIEEQGFYYTLEGEEISYGL